MKSRIPKIWLSLALTVPMGYGIAQGIGVEAFGSFTTTVLFYANVPARLCEVVTNLRRSRNGWIPPAPSAISSNP